MLPQNKLLLILPFVLMAWSCTKVHNTKPGPVCEQPQPDPATCSFWQPAIGVSAISGPATATVGQSVLLAVTTTARNGCAAQASVSSLPFGNDISLTGNIFYSGCICTEALMDMSTTYYFTPTQTGIYTFHGETYDGAPVVYTLTVQ